MLILDQEATNLKKLTGMSLDELTQKFAAGWTLKPPDPPLKLAKDLCLKEKENA